MRDISHSTHQQKTCFSFPHVVSFICKWEILLGVGLEKNTWREGGERNQHPEKKIENKNEV